MSPTPYLRVGVYALISFRTTQEYTMASRARPKATKKPRGRPRVQFLSNRELEAEIFKTEDIRIVIRDTAFNYRSYREIFPTPLKKVDGTVREFFQRMAELGVGSFVIFHYDEKYNLVANESKDYGHRGSPFKASASVDSIRFYV